MQFKTKELYSAMLLTMAETYGVETVTEVYNVQPTIEQELIDKIVESDAFLSTINMVPVDEIKGQKVMGSVTVSKGKRTDTSAGDREPADLIALGAKNYELASTEYDFALPWVTLDSWAKFPDFQDRYGQWVRKSIALSKIRTAWYGESAAPVTDDDSLMGEDTNKGFFQILREYNSGSQFLTNTSIKIGSETGNTYPNIDSAVHDLLQLIDPIHRGPGLQVYIGDDLLADEKARLYAAHAGTPTEKEREKIESSIATFAGLPKAMTPAFFPGRAILIADPANLSMYYQSGSMRRYQMDNPKRNRVEDFNSVNEGYVIEDENAAAAIDFTKVYMHDGSKWLDSEGNE